MHEFSICQTLVEQVLDELSRVEPPPMRILKTRIAVGELRQIVPAFLQSAYETLIKDTILDGSKLDIRNLPLLGECQGCSWQGNLSKELFRCPECESGNLKLVGGMELYLEQLEVEEFE